MKIYFAGTVRGDRGKSEAFKHAVAFLKKRGHRVLTESIADAAALEAEREMPDGEMYKLDIGWLEGADVVIAEITKPSFGVGMRSLMPLKETSRCGCCMKRAARKTFRPWPSETTTQK